tara:strand:- start:3114 stop:6101 length:2988 start_codon:yes stop_codon:yes gene_type:complete
MTDTTPTDTTPTEKPAGPSLRINGKLLLSLSFLAAMSVVAGIIAWYSFDYVSKSTELIAHQSLPEIETAMQLAQKSAEISSSAPDLMANLSLDDHKNSVSDLNRRAFELSALMEKSRELYGSTENVENLLKIEQQLVKSLDTLKSAVEAKLSKREARNAATDQLSRLHEAFLLKMEPMIDDAVFDFVMQGEWLSAKSNVYTTDLVENSTRKVSEFLEFGDRIDDLEGVLSEVILASDLDSFGPLQTRYNTLETEIEENVANWAAQAGQPAFVELAQDILDFGRGLDNIFILKEQELWQTPPGQSTTLSPRLVQKGNLLRLAHESFHTVYSQAVVDVVENLETRFQDEARQSGAELGKLILDGANNLHILLSLRAEGNLVASILGEMSNVPDVANIEPFADRFEASEARIRDMLAGLATDDMQNITLSLLALGSGDNNLFDIHRAELDSSGRAAVALRESRALSDSLQTEVAKLVAGARERGGIAESNSEQVIELGKYLLVLVAIASLATALLVMFLYIRPRIIRPLENITDAMTQLAAGDTGVKIPWRERNDEVGDMANALAVFRDTAIEIQESNHREIEEGRRRLINAIENISEGFSLYDSNDKLVVCNSVYRDLFFPKKIIETEIGKSFEDIMRRAATQGLVQDAWEREDEWLRERLKNHRKRLSTEMQRRADDRWILINERKTEDGSTVAVYSDITQIKQQEQAISEQSRALERLSNQLAKYLSPQVYASIFEGRNRGDITSRRKKLTVFFSDIVGFTEITERMEAEDLTRILNQYLTEMSEIALVHGATIDKFVGDAIVIFFGDPESKGVKQDAIACVRMALAMRERLAELNDVWFDIGLERPLQCRMGINTGYCTVGNFGSSERMDYTAIGNGVNLASRLESTANTGEIQISHETYVNVKDVILCGKREEITVKGFRFPVNTYAALQELDHVPETLDVIQEENENLKLDINLKEMSPADRRKTEALLQKVLSRISTEAQEAPTDPDAKDD